MRHYTYLIQDDLVSEGSAIPKVVKATVEQLVEAGIKPVWKPNTTIRILPGMVTHIPNNGDSISVDEEQE